MPQEFLRIEDQPGTQPGQRILRLHGALVMTTMFEFQAMVRADASRSLIIDFTNVPYIDSAGLGIVLSHWAHTQRIGVKFAAVGISERVQVLLDMTGVSKLLPQYPTAADAERAFSSVTNSPSVASV